MRIVIILLFILLGPALALSDTLVVPDDHPTIQAAIDAAKDDDTVLVKPGTYMENIDFAGKEIIVKSTAGCDHTVIDGGSPSHPDRGSTVTFQNGEGPGAVLEGFTITNGTGTHHITNTCGGGIFCDSSSPTIQGNVITNNSVWFDGGGIFCLDGAPRILDNTITHNWHDYLGGGICCENAAARIAGNFIAWNGYPWAEMGGGIYFEYQDQPFIVNNIIVENKAVDGAGITGMAGNARLLNNTIARNEGAGYGWGGGIYVANENLIVTNSIVCNNYPNQIEGNSVIVEYSNIEGGWPGTGNIDDYPCFVDWFHQDYHLSHHSPCRNAGLNTAAGLPEVDFERDPRIAFGTVDMGADEFYTHLYWTGDATPGGTVQVKFVGTPGTAPVSLCIGTGVLKNPIKTNWGDWWNDWWLKFPIIGPIDLGLMPYPDGVLKLGATIPYSPPGPYIVAMQALVGDNLTNLSILYVE